MLIELVRTLEVEGGKSRPGADIESREQEIFQNEMAQWWVPNDTFSGIHGTNLRTADSRRYLLDDKYKKSIVIFRNRIRTLNDWFYGKQNILPWFGRRTISSTKNELKDIFRESFF